MIIVYFSHISGENFFMDDMMVKSYASVVNSCVCIIGHLWGESTIRFS